MTGDERIVQLLDDIALHLQSAVEEQRTANLIAWHGLLAAQYHPPRAGSGGLGQEMAAMQSIIAERLGRA